MDNNRVKIINSTLDKIKNGITKGTWCCDFYKNTYSKENKDFLFLDVTAFNQGYKIEFGYELECSSKLASKYWFSIHKDNKVTYEITELKVISDSLEFSLIREYIKLLLEEYKKAIVLIPD
ncbi:hypothetical protein NIES2107_30560 [Nostoc carneum NIES-2107]|nr:hypothetical protein NIES2107_30560 [Nostoc carneum NIES-2107]